MIKSLLMSQFNNLVISLPNPDNVFISKLHTILFNFLCSGNSEKVKRDVMTQIYSEGGLKMVNVRCFIDALNLGWVRRLFQNSEKWQIILKSVLDIDLLANCGTDYIRKCTKKCKNKFWIDVLNARGKCNNLYSKQHEGEQLLFT